MRRGCPARGGKSKSKSKSKSLCESPLYTVEWQLGHGWYQNGSGGRWCRERWKCVRLSLIHATIAREPCGVPARSVGAGEVMANNFDVVVVVVVVGMRSVGVAWGSQVGGGLGGL